MRNAPVRLLAIAVAAVCGSVAYQMTIEQPSSNGSVGGLTVLVTRVMIIGLSFAAVALVLLVIATFVWPRLKQS